MLLPIFLGHVICASFEEWLFPISSCSRAICHFFVLWACPLAGKRTVEVSLEKQHSPTAQVSQHVSSA